MDDRQFLAAFEAAAIPAASWTHRDHVRMAFLYLRDQPFEAALACIRDGIRALNVANGGQNTASSGYHESVTVAWATLVATAIGAVRTAVSAEANARLADSERFIAAHPELLDKDRLRRHYSKDCLMSAEARTGYVPPDLEPLPRLAPEESALDPGSAAIESLLLDLLEWLAPEPRPQDEVMAAWRTSCPRFPVWEEANARGLVARRRDLDGIARVSLTSAGRERLRTR